MAFLKQQREVLRATSENNEFETSTEWLKESLKTPSREEFLPISVSDIRLGRFYFILYNLNGKSTKVEKYNPCFPIGFKQYGKWNSLYVVNTNFLPYELRNRFFDIILERYDARLAEDYDKSFVEQQFEYEIKFDEMYKELFRYGFEWTIRNIITANIDKVFEVHTARYIELLNVNTYDLTGIDEKAIEKIWLAKIREQEKREKLLLKELAGDITPDELVNMTAHERRAKLADSGLDLAKFLST